VCGFMNCLLYRCMYSGIMMKSESTLSDLHEIISSDKGCSRRKSHLNRRMHQQDYPLCR
jgi:hypothetical protein